MLNRRQKRFIGSLIASDLGDRWIAGIAVSEHVKDPASMHLGYWKGSWSAMLAYEGAKIGFAVVWDDYKERLFSLVIVQLESAFDD